MERARAHFATAQTVAPMLHEGWFNGALLAFKSGDFQEAFRLASRAAQIRSDHTDTADLIQQLKSMFSQI
jgi:tetratricopeptide repeat protein 8